MQRFGVHSLSRTALSMQHHHIIGEVDVENPPPAKPSCSVGTFRVHFSPPCDHLARFYDMVGAVLFPFPAFWHRILALHVSQSIGTSRHAELLKHTWQYRMRVPNGPRTAPPSRNFGRLSLMHQRSHRDTTRPLSR